MKLRITLGVGLATAAVAATLSCLSAPALATPAPGTPWDQALTGSPIDVATTADGGTAVVLVDGGYDEDTNADLDDVLQWRSAATGAVTATVTLPTADANALAVASDGTVAVVGEAGDDADRASLWTVAPGSTDAATTTLADNSSDAGSVAIAGDTAVIGGDDDGISLLWSVPLSDLTTVTSTTLSTSGDDESQSVAAVGIAGDGTAYAAIDVYDDTTDAYSTQLWQVRGGVGTADAAAAAVMIEPYSSAGLAIADGLVQVAVSADPVDTNDARLLTFDPSTATTTDRDLGLTYPSSVTTFDDQVLVATLGGDALVPATGTTSYTEDSPAPVLELDAGSAQKVVVEATEATGIAPYDATSTDGGPSVFEVTAPATPAPHVAVHNGTATVSWAWPDSGQDSSAPSDGGAVVDTYSVTATDTTVDQVLPTVTRSWESAFDGSGISLTVPRLVAGHSYTFVATQSNGLYTSDLGGTRTTVPLPATAAPSRVSVSGTPMVGKKLTVKNTGSWAKGAHLTYVWYANATKVGTAASYTPKSSNVGKRIKVVVTGTVAGHTATPKTSAAVGPVKKPIYVVKAKVTVTGTPKVGTSLTAHIGKLPKGAKVTWEWAESFSQYGGLVSNPRASSVYKIPARAKGGRLVAIAIVTVPGYQPGEAESRFTAVVKK